ncbi:3260_t:CDS:2 [Gigaspora rosea]|nr:3260_t:CDS:2 [Gigaspora rosea]
MEKETYLEESSEDFSIIDIDENWIFDLPLGWALKCNQKYGKKGQCDSSDRYTAKDMLKELNEIAENGELMYEVIPSLKTIENWFTRFSSSSKKEQAERFLEK